MFSCTLHPIGTCFCVLIVLRFAFCLYLQHTTHPCLRWDTRPQSQLGHWSVVLIMDSIPGPSSPQRVTTPTARSRPHFNLPQTQFLDTSSSLRAAGTFLYINIVPRHPLQSEKKRHCKPDVETASLCKLSSVVYSERQNDNNSLLFE